MSDSMRIIKFTVCYLVALGLGAGYFVYKIASLESQLHVTEQQVQLQGRLLDTMGAGGMTINIDGESYFPVIVPKRSSMWHTKAGAQ
jgi:hypothetical protein